LWLGGLAQILHRHQVISLFLMKPVPTLHPLLPVTMSWVSLVISLIRRLRHVDNKSLLLQFCVTNQLGIFCVLLQSCTGTAESCLLPSCSILPSPVLFHAPFRTCPSQVGRQYISGSVIVIVIRDLLSGVFLGLEGLCENKATYVANFLPDKGPTSTPASFTYSSRNRQVTSQAIPSPEAT